LKPTTLYSPRSFAFGSGHVPGAFAPGTNYHRIGVNFAAVGGPSEKYIQDITERERSTKVDAKVYGGLVSVFTIDDINVDVAIRVLTEATNQSIETASFIYALQQQPK
jgi:hypothetical protein